MGWASGSYIMSSIIECIEEFVPKHQEKVEIYYRLIDVFTDSDCDTLDECIDESTAFKEALSKRMKEYGIDDQEEDYSSE